VPKEDKNEMIKLEARHCIYI